MPTPLPITPRQINKSVVEVAIQKESVKAITTTKKTIPIINNNSNRRSIERIPLLGSYIHIPEKEILNRVDTSSETTTWTQTQIIPP